MFETLKEVFNWTNLFFTIAPWVILFFLSLVALINCRFWMPVFIHLIAYGGAVVTFLALITIPRDEPYTINELLRRLLIFPAAVYGVYILFGGPLIKLEEMIEKGKKGESLSEPYDSDEKSAKDTLDEFAKNSIYDSWWFKIIWLVIVIISILFSIIKYQEP